MDAGKLRTFDPTALLRRPDAAAGPAGTPRFDAAAFTTQAVLDLASEATAGNGTPTPAGTPSPSSGTPQPPGSGTSQASSSGTPQASAPGAPSAAGADAQAATRAGLIVSLSDRALDSAATARLLTDILTPADYTHLRPGLPQPNRAAEQAALEQSRLQPFPRLPVTREVEEQTSRRPTTGRSERAAAGSVVTALPLQAGMNGRDEPRGLADRSERAASLSATALLPSQEERREGGVRQGSQQQIEPFAPLLQAAVAGVAAGQAQRIAAPPPAEPIQPRPVPEIMAQFFSRTEAQPRTRWSIGKLLLAAAALAIIALLLVL